MPRLMVIAGDPLQGDDAALDWMPLGLPVIRRSGAELAATQLFEDLGQPGMFAETRLLIYSDVLAARLSRHESERCSKLLAELPAETHLACVQVIHEETRSKTDARLKSAGLRLFSDGAKLLDLRTQAEGTAAARWLLERAEQRHGVHLTLPQSTRILRASADSPSMAAAVLLKLGLLKESEGPATVAEGTLDDLLQNSPVQRFYDFVDKLLDNPGAAQPMLLEHFAGEPETFRLIGELKRRLLQVRSVRRGEPVFPPFAVRGAQALARRLNDAGYAEALQALAKLEQGLKSGAYPASSSHKAELTGVQLLAASLAAALRR